MTNWGNFWDESNDFFDELEAYPGGPGVFINHRSPIEHPRGRWDPEGGKLKLLPNTWEHGELVETRVYYIGDAECIDLIYEDGYKRTKLGKVWVN